MRHDDHFAADQVVWLTADHDAYNHRLAELGSDRPIGAPELAVGIRCAAAVGWKNGPHEQNKLHGSTLILL